MNTSDNPSSLESREVSLMYKKGNPSVKKPTKQREKLIFSGNHTQNYTAIAQNISKERVTNI